MIWLIITVIIVLSDQLTKYIIKTNIEYGEMIPVIENFLYITHHSNTGAAWGLFSNSTLFLTILSGIVIILIAAAMPKFNTVLLKWAFSFILGGAIGNQIDRILFGRVTDFIDTYYWGYNFPIFNVADSSIVIGSILLLIYMFFYYKDEDFSFLERKAAKEKNNT